MAKTKEPSIQDALKSFKDVFKRLNIISVQKQNRNLLCNTNKKQNVFIRIDSELWNLIMEDPISETFKDVDPSDKFTVMLLNSIPNDDNNWVDINAEDFQLGKLINIQLDGYDYKISISKDNLILKLKKAELSDIGYQIGSINMVNSQVVNKVLKLRKRFIGPVENSTFDIMTAFIII